MMKYLKYSLLIVLLFVIGCTGKGIADYNDEDVAAIVNGEEITIAELRFLYPDEEALDMLDGTVKAKLVVQEVKQMNLDVSAEPSEEMVSQSYLLTGNNDDPLLKPTREFVKSQSQKLNMKEDDYLKEYTEITSEQMAYLTAYVQDVLGEPGNDEDRIEAYNDEANQMLDDLVKKHNDEIEILIQ